MSANAAFIAAGLLLATHPLVVWAVAGGHGVELAFYFLLTWALAGLMRYGDVRSIVGVAFCIAAALLADARLIYVMLVLVPSLALLAPPHMIRKSPASFFLVVLFPAASLLCGFLYIHALFKGLHFGVMQMLSPKGALPALDHFPWHHEYGGLFLLPAFLFVAAAFAAFPLAMMAPFILRAERLAAMPLLVAALVPLFAACLAIKLPFPDYPAAAICLISAPAAYAAQALIARRRTPLALALLALGWLGGAAMVNIGVAL